jgi:hypothetical protein
MSRITQYFGLQQKKEVRPMAKLSKSKEVFKDYTVSVLVGSAVLLGLLALATSIHHMLMLLGIAVLLGVVLYTLWRML